MQDTRAYEDDNAIMMAIKVDLSFTKGYAINIMFSVKA